MTDRDPLLTERQTTHGNFKQNAELSQALKDNARFFGHWKKIDPVEQEAIDMIFLKFSRILSGKSLERQHWEDVVGYAKLALEQCK